MDSPRGTPPAFLLRSAVSAPGWVSRRGIGSGRREMILPAWPGWTAISSSNQSPAIPAGLPGCCSYSYSYYYYYQPLAACTEGDSGASPAFKGSLAFLKILGSQSAAVGQEAGWGFIQLPHNKRERRSPLPSPDTQNIAEGGAAAGFQSSSINGMSRID